MKSHVLESRESLLSVEMMTFNQGCGIRVMYPLPKLFVKPILYDRRGDHKVLVAVAVPRLVAVDVDRLDLVLPLADRQNLEAEVRTVRSTGRREVRSRHSLKGSSIVARYSRAQNRPTSDPIGLANVTIRSCHRTSGAA